MATSSGDSLEKLEDMIVRAAETTAKHVAAAKEAIGAVIFGQDKVIEQALITLLCGGPVGTGQAANGSRLFASIGISGILRKP